MLTGMLYVQATSKWHVFNLQGSTLVVYQDVIPTESPEPKCIEYDDYLLVPGKAFGESRASLSLVVQKTEYLNLTKQPLRHCSVSPTGVIRDFALGCYGLSRSNTPLSPTTRIATLEFEFDALNYLYPPIRHVDTGDQHVGGISPCPDVQFDFSVAGQTIRAELLCWLVQRFDNPGEPYAGSTRLVLHFDPQPVPFAMRVFTVIRQFMQFACFCKEVGPYEMRMQASIPGVSAGNESVEFSTGLGLPSEARYDLRVSSRIPSFTLWQPHVGSLLSNLSEESWFTIDPVPDTVHDRDSLTYFRILASCTALFETAKPAYEADIRGQKKKQPEQPCPYHDNLLCYRRNNSISLPDILHEAFKRFWSPLELARHQVACSVGLKNFSMLLEFNEADHEPHDSEKAKIDYWCKIIADMRNRRAHRPFNDSYTLEQVVAARFVDMLWYAVTLKRCKYTMQEISALICEVFGTGQPAPVAAVKPKQDDG